MSLRCASKRGVLSQTAFDSWQLGIVIDVSGAVLYIGRKRQKMRDGGVNGRERGGVMMVKMVAVCGR